MHAASFALLLDLFDMGEDYKDKWAFFYKVALHVHSQALNIGSQYVNVDREATFHHRDI